MNHHFLMKIKTHYIAITLLLSSVFSMLHAQTIDVDRNTFIFDRQWRIGLTTALYDNLEIEHQAEPLLKSSPTFSGELTLSYYQELAKNFGLNVGVAFSIASYNMNFDFEASENSAIVTNSTSTDRDLFSSDYEYLHLITSVPFSFQKIIENKHNRYYSVELGTKLNSLIFYPYQVTSGHGMSLDNSGFNSLRFFDSKLEDTGFRYFFSFFTKIGLVKINRNINTLHYNLVLHWSPKKIGEGTYQFSNVGIDSYGTLKHNVNYIGFEVCYGFTKNYTLKHRFYKGVK